MATYPEGAIDVDTAAALDQAIATLATAPEIAVDVESDSMHAFRARLCFMQLGTDRDVFLLDTLRAEVRVAALAELFGDPGRTKFFHAAGGDLIYLAEAGVRVRGLFDTHRAATFLGMEKVGLADLVRQELGIDLAKEHQKADFSIRPLAPSVRAYIADDVRYLCEIGRRLIAACREKDILDETLLDCARLEADARVPADAAAAAPPVPRKGLTPDAWRLAQAVSRELHRWRMTRGEERNVPAGRILSKAAILDLALLRPIDLAVVVRQGNLNRSFVRDHGSEVLAILRKVEGLAAAGALPEEPAAVAPDPGSRKRDDALRTFRGEQAAARKVTPSVVLTGALIAEIVAARPVALDDLARLPYFGAKRVELYGRGILEVLRGVG